MPWLFLLWSTNDVDWTEQLTHKEGPKVAGPAVHHYSADVADSDEETVGGLQVGSAGLMQGEEPRLRAPGPTHTAGGLHQQDGDGVGAHLQGATQQRTTNI